MSESNENPIVENVVSTEGSEVSEVVESNEPAKPNESDVWNQRFSRLTKEEQRLQNQRSELSAQKEALESYNKIQELVKSNPMEALQQLGISYEDLVQAQVDAYQETQKTPEQRQLEELQSKLERFETSAQEKEAKQLEQQRANDLANFNSLMSSHLSENKDNYPYLAGFEADSLNDAFLETATVLYQENGVEPTEAQVCELLNATYEEQLSRFQHMFQPKQESTEAPEEAKQPSISPSTLHSGNNSTGHKVTPKDSERPLTAEERRQRAMAALGILNN